MAGTVEDRVARAEGQGAFLFAPVEILDTYEPKGYSAKEAEKAIHHMLRPYHVALKVTGPDSRALAATEWFKVDRAIVDEAVMRFLRVDAPPAKTAASG